jgi:hypothetical protein
MDTLLMLISPKPRKIIQVVLSFLAKHRLLEKPTMFDLVGLTIALEGTFQMELLENGFQLG